MSSPCGSTSLSELSCLHQKGTSHQKTAIPKHASTSSSTQAQKHRHTLTGTHTQALTHIHTDSHTHTHTLSLFFFLFLSLTLSFLPVFFSLTVQVIAPGPLARKQCVPAFPGAQSLLPSWRVVFGLTLLLNGRAPLQITPKQQSASVMDEWCDCFFPLRERVLSNRKGKRKQNREAEGLPLCFWENQKSKFIQNGGKVKIDFVCCWAKVNFVFRQSQFTSACFCLWVEHADRDAQARRSRAW